MIKFIYTFDSCLVLVLCSILSLTSYCISSLNFPLVLRYSGRFYVQTKMLSNVRQYTLYDFSLFTILIIELLHINVY